VLRLSFILLLLSIASPAWAQDADSQEGSNQLAALLQDSYLAFETDGDVASALRIADILERQGHTGERGCRYAHYARVHLDPSAPEQLRHRAVHHARRCGERLVRLVVRVSPGHARVDLDGAPVGGEGRLPRWPRFVSPGRHTLHAAAHGYHPVRRDVRADAGSIEITLELESRYPVKTDASGSEPRGVEIGGHYYPHIGWGIAGVSVASALLVAGAGVTAWGFEGGRPTAARLGGLGLLNAGAHVLGVGLMGMFWMDDPPEDARVPHLSVAMSPERGGVTATWRF
jgi:hypothetical protein